MELTLQHYLLGAILALSHVLGTLTAINAVLTHRSSQSAVAWVLSCIMMPYLAVPAYWVFGRNRYAGYVLARRTSDRRLNSLVEKVWRTVPPRKEGTDARPPYRCVFERVAGMPFTRGNAVELFSNVERYFDSVFEHISRAQNYVLIQFFIVRSDPLGQRMRDALIRKAKEGVRVYFLFDRIGSYALSSAYVRSLRDAGVDVRAFPHGRSWPYGLQINLRNHRKIVVVDGTWAGTGGANLGDEYLGRNPKIGHWRDTTVAARGPAVQEIQLSFVEDWFFIAGEVPELEWRVRPGEAGDDDVLVMPTGPADDLHSCSMMFTQAIHSATKRLWITTPYFVPDNEIVRALQLAALRGVDVRLLIPGAPDRILAHWASLTYLDELRATGVKFFRYEKGRLHQKVILVDNTLAFIGSANTDNRSFYLNFELTMIIENADFAALVRTMLERDFEDSSSAFEKRLDESGLPLRIAAQLARLLAPVL